MKQLTKNEQISIGLIFDNLSAQEGEDIIGVLIKNGCFKYLKDDKLVNLANKIEEFIKLKKDNLYFNKRFISKI
jgi:hypothetical protein